jgi:hypothetical protein
LTPVNKPIVHGHRLARAWMSGGPYGPFFKKALHDDGPNLYGIFTGGCVTYTGFLRARRYILHLRVQENAMDFIYVGLIVGFVALSIGLVYYCERLRRPQ